MSEVLKFSNSAQCAVLLISPCFNISAYPEKKLCASSVRKNSVSINTLFAGANEPISFFSPLKLIPVLPPTEASTIASKVVGILMYAIPRLKVAAAKPPKSVTIPPPRLMSNEWRVAPWVLSDIHTEASVSSVLCTSSAPMQISIASFNAGSSFKAGRQRRRVCSSVRMNNLACGHCYMARLRLVSKLSQRITSCLLMILLLFYFANVYKISFFTYFCLVKTFKS